MSAGDSTAVGVETFPVRVVIRSLLRLMADPFLMVVRYRRLLISAVINEVRQRYAGLVAGMVWAVLWPLVFMMLYAIIYVGILRIRPVGLTPAEYVLYMFAGLIPLVGFVEALNAGTGSLSANRAVLLNTVFPAELVPVRAVLAGHATTSIGLAIVICGAVGLGKLSPTLLAVPVLLLFQVMFVIGVTWLLALVNLALRDIQQFLAFAAMILLIVSPVSYTPDMVPSPLAFVIYLNPFSYFVVAFHDLVVFSRVPGPGVIVACAVLGIGSFCVGHSIFRRVKPIFLDYA
jgi:lipopolysaccharide transport system permease protein